MQTIGTCGNCGGPVQAPTHWGGSEPPPQKCARCGASPINQYGPVLPMTPSRHPSNRTPGSAYDLGTLHRQLRQQEKT